MNVNFLQENQEQLYQSMKDTGYSSGYIFRFQVLVRYILTNNEHENWDSYVDIYESFKRTTASLCVMKQARAVFSGIKRFHLEGICPGGKGHHAIIHHDIFDDLVPEFRQLITYYRCSEKERGKKEGTIYTESNCAVTFLFSMQKNGCPSLAGISESAMLSFFLDEDGCLAKSQTYVKNLRAVFKAGLSWKHDECRHVLCLLPRIRRSRKIIQYLTNDETAKVKDILRNPGAALSLRDRAIGLLLVHYGIRRSDISGLKMDSIDWDKSLIKITQQKTDYPYEMPLIPIVGNAIYDYITLERGDTSIPYVFLTQRTPCRHEIGVTTVNDVVGRILKAAGLRQNPGERRGAHIFRHHFATALMGNGIPQPVISMAMGHSDPGSVETYLAADFMHLKECALSIEKYPINEEVFSVCGHLN